MGNIHSKMLVAEVKYISNNQ